MALILSNTGWFGPGDPIMRRGLSGIRGLGAMDESGMFAADPASPWYTDPKTITAANSELLFVTNWWRGISGQAPLAASQYAPQVSVGLSQDTQNMVLLGGAALLAVVLLKGKRGKKRRR